MIKSGAPQAIIAHELSLLQDLLRKLYGHDLMHAVHQIDQERRREHENN